MRCRQSGGLEIANLVEDLFIFRETKRLQFRENSLPVNRHFKRPAVALDEDRHPAVFFLDSSLQTCSLGLIVSFDTIFNADVHMRRSLLLTMLGLHSHVAILAAFIGGVKFLSRRLWVVMRDDSMVVLCPQNTSTVCIWRSEARASISTSRTPSANQALAP